MQITSDTDVDLAFDYIANSVADLAAKQARINNIDNFVTLNDEIQRHDERWWDLLFRFLCLHCSNGTGLPTGMEAAQTSFFLQRLLHPTLIFLQSWPKGECHNFTCPTISPEVREAMYYSSTYTIAFSWMAPNAGVAGWNRTRRSWNHFFGIVHQLLLCYGESCAFQYCGQEIEGANLPSLRIWFCWWSRCHILCINNCVSSNFLWHTLWSFLGIRHFPSDVKQMCLLWFRLVLGLQERGYVGDRSFHFGNGSSVIWRTLVFSNLVYKSIDGFFFAETWSSYPNGFYKMTIWWETRILLTRNFKTTVENVNDSFGNLCAGFFSRDKTGRFGWEFSPWVYWWPLLRRTEMIDLDMGIQLFSQSFWLGCGCVSRLSRGSVFWWDHQGGLTRDSRVRSSDQNPGWLGYLGD